MAELTIDPRQIGEALRRNLEGWEPGLEASAVGYVATVGDGVARVAGLPGTMANELLEFPDGLDRGGAQPRRGLGGSGHPRRGLPRPRGRPGAPDRPGALGAGGRRLARPGHRRPGRAHGRQGPDQHHRAPPAGDPGPVGSAAPPGAPAAADRDQGHRRHDAHRPGPARADHRRPPDRQDRHRGGHDHQPARRRGEVHLRGHRPEVLHRGRGGGGARGARAPWSTPWWSTPRPRRRRRCRCTPPTPARPSASTGCTRASTPWSSSTTSPSRRWPTARSRCCCGAPRAARPTRATSSTCTPGCWSAAPSSATSWAAARSPACPSSRPRPATSPPTSPPT